MSDIVENLVRVRTMKDRISECINSTDKMKSEQTNKKTCISEKEKKSMHQVFSDMKDALQVYEERCIELLSE